MADQHYKTVDELVAQYGIHKGTLQYHIKEGGQLHPFLTSNNKINTYHSKVKKFIALHRRQTEGDSPASPVSVPQPDATAQMGELADLPFKEVVARFGTDTKMKGWLDALKKIEDIEEKRLKNQKAREEVIKRDIVEKYVFSYLNMIQSRLLHDLPKTLGIKLDNAIKIGVPLEQIEGSIREDISRHYKGAKEKITENL